MVSKRKGPTLLAAVGSIALLWLLFRSLQLTTAGINSSAVKDGQCRNPFASYCPAWTPKGFSCVTESYEVDCKAKHETTSGARSLKCELEGAKWLCGLDAGGRPNNACLQHVAGVGLPQREAAALRQFLEAMCPMEDDKLCAQPKSCNTWTATSFDCKTASGYTIDCDLTKGARVDGNYALVCEYGMPDFSCLLVDGAADCPSHALEPLPANSRGQLTWLLSEHAKCVAQAAAEAFPLASSSGSTLQGGGGKGERKMKRDKAGRSQL